VLAQGPDPRTAFKFRTNSYGLTFLRQQLKSHPPVANPTSRLFPTDQEPDRNNPKHLAASREYKVPRPQALRRSRICRTTPAHEARLLVLATPRTGYQRRRPHPANSQSRRPAKISSRTALYPDAVRGRTRTPCLKYAAIVRDPTASLGLPKLGPPQAKPCRRTRTLGLEKTELAATRLCMRQQKPPRDLALPVCPHRPPVIYDVRPSPTRCRHANCLPGSVGPEQAFTSLHSSKA